MLPVENESKNSRRGPSVDRNPRPTLGEGRWARDDCQGMVSSGLKLWLSISKQSCPRKEGKMSRLGTKLGTGVPAETRFAPPCFNETKNRLKRVPRAFKLKNVLYR